MTKRSARRSSRAWETHPRVGKNTSQFRLQLTEIIIPAKRRNTPRVAPRLRSKIHNKTHQSTITNSQTEEHASNYTSSMHTENGMTVSLATWL